MGKANDTECPGVGEVFPPGHTGEAFVAEIERAAGEKDQDEEEGDEGSGWVTQVKGEGSKGSEMGATPPTVPTATTVEGRPNGKKQQLHGDARLQVGEGGEGRTSKNDARVFSISPRARKTDSPTQRRSKRLCKEATRGLPQEARNEEVPRRVTRAAGKS